jgi:hypothetical protein
MSGICVVQVDLGGVLFERAVGYLDGVVSGVLGVPKYLISTLKTVDFTDI